MNPYLKEYRWSNIGAMIKNNKAIPQEELNDYKGKLVVITGATSGIGYETAKLFASNGADLLLINRNQEKSVRVKNLLEQQYNIRCSIHVADFTRLEDIHITAQMLTEIDRDISVLIHNAGVFNTRLRLTQDGIEEVFQVNYLSSFIITYLIKEKLMNQKSARILLVNSEGHRFSLSGLNLDDLVWKKHHYTGLKSYGVAKTAQLLSLFPFSDYFKHTGVSINAMHPGDVKTNMGENNGKLYKWFKQYLINPSARSPEISAKALYFLGVSEALDGVTGKFFNLTTKEIPAPHALDRKMAEKLWDMSLKWSSVT